MSYLKKRWWLLLLVLGGVALLLFLAAGKNERKEAAQITTTVERGDVVNSVSVSGFVEAKNTAELAFPSTGLVTDVLVDEGTVVSKGDILATLAAAQLVAERAEAVASFEAAIANFDEAVAGPRAETIAVANRSIDNAIANLDRIERESDETVALAYSTLLSNDLEALSVESQENATPPTISGTYTCGVEGSYIISVYRSGSASGFSYSFSGLETGIGPATTDQPDELGTCGLFIQFSANGSYSDSTWRVDIPNTRSATYLTKANAYAEALTQQTNQIEAATDALSLAREEAALTTADTRSETLRSTEARVSEARARIARIDAQIADRSIVAPFSGTVTDVDILPGETAGSAAVITLLAEDAFELKARIPEIDIRKITEGLPVEVVFDASIEETLLGTISYITPVATEIDGVAYFEATITLDELPTWVRSGLNADIEIIVETLEDVLRLPKRFVTENESNEQIVTVNDTAAARKNQTIELPIDIVAEGNNGYVAIDGILEGRTVILPE